MDIIIILSLVLFVILIFSGIPLPVSSLGTTIFLVILKGYNPNFLFSAGFFKLNSVTLLAMPFFVAAGYIIAGGSIASRLVNFINVLVGRIKGGLGVVAIFVCLIFGAVSGAAASSIIAIGTIMIPQMEKQGYPRGYSTALISSASVLSTMIPPSLAMIIFAFITGNSVAACFLATVGPAILVSILFSVANIIMVRNIPTIVASPKVSIKEIVKDFGIQGRKAVLAFLFPVIILGGIYGGIMTPTEAAAVAVLYAIILSVFIYREMSFGKMMLLLRSSACASGTMMIMLFFTAMLTRLYTMEQVPQQMSSFLFSISSNKIILMLLINLILIATGMIVDEFTGILLVSPILYPFILKLGINPIHFAAIMGVNLGMGMMTPPMAGMMYIGARVGKVTIDKMFKTSMILIFFCSIPVLIVTTFWPPLSLFIPRLLGFVR